MQPESEMSFVRGAAGSDLDMLVVHNLLRTNNLLLPLLDADLRQRNLTGAQLNVLMVLRAAGPDGLRMNEIGRKLVVTKSNVTGLVDRLERSRLVERVSQRDRRATVVRLTACGRRAIDRTVPDHARMLGHLVDGLSQREKTTLIRILTKLRRALRHARGAE